MSTAKILPGEYLYRVGVPEKFCHVTLEQYLPGVRALKLGRKDEARYEQIVEYATKIVDDILVGFYFYGSNGSGKSSLGAACLREYLVLKNMRVARTTAQEILTYYFKDYKGFRPRYTESDVLLIEEINKEVDLGSQHSLKIIEGIIKGREEAGKITCFTSNCDPEALLDKYGETVFNIIKGTTVAIDFPSVDIRELEMKKYVQSLKSGE